ncbi:hypothetical protein FACS189416_2130 [Bacteroidia bacterium]|nr:hypothetical protein FACS189416_2130 [Bacteroidia bacterium]
MALIVLVPFTMQFGNKIRGEYHETEIQYATSVYSFFEKTFMRNQGLSRLMVVIYNNEEHYTPFNDFFVFNLMNNDFTATKYIDKNYYNIPVDQHHSQGGSGVGCLYLDLGMFGVFIGYFLFALVFLYIFNSLSHFKDNDFYIVVYANLAILARYALQENFGIEILKRIFVVILMSLFWLYVLRNKRNVLK